MSAWDWMGSLALLPVGYLLSGPVGRDVGNSELLVVGGLVGVAVMALALLPGSTRSLQRIAVPAPDTHHVPAGAV